MKTISLGSLLLLGLAGERADAASALPCGFLCFSPSGWLTDILSACLVDCTHSLANRFSSAGTLRTFCDGAASQRLSQNPCSLQSHGFPHILLPAPFSNE